MSDTPKVDPRAPLDGETIIEVRYAGRREAKSGGLAYFYEFPDGQLHGYKKRLGSYEAIGARYRVAESAAGIRPSSFTFAGDGERDAKAAEWAMDDRMAYEQDAARKAAKRLQKDRGDLGSYTLASMKRAIGGLPVVQRRAAVVVVVDYLLGRAGFVGDV